MLGQVKTSEKSNEITAIPELPDMLILDGCVVTVDAMGTQKEIAKTIRDKEADYVLAVKENQPALYADVRDYFEGALADKTGGFKWEERKQNEKGHGQIEKRRYYCSTDIEWLDQKKEWKDINLFSKAVRKHWGVEAMHWNLDVTFREAEMRSHKDNLPKNLGALKRIALNMLKRETSVKKSMNVKRQKACLKEGYLEKIILG